MTDAAEPGLARRIAPQIPLRRFAGWWTSEFAALFPEALADRLTGSGGGRLMLRMAGADVSLELTRGARALALQRHSAAGFSPAVLDAFLASRALARAEVELCLALPAARFFIRSFDIPVEARGWVAGLAAAEIERRTPFRLDQIHHGYCVEPVETGTKLRVHQAIIRRDLVEGEAQNLSMDVQAFDQLSVADGLPPEGKIIIALRQRAPAGPAPARLLLGLCLSAALLAVSAFAATAWRREQNLGELDKEIAVTRPKSVEARASADRIAREQAMTAQIRARKSGAPMFVEVLDEVTRLLPDSAWVTEIRLLDGRSGERIVSMTGFAPAAAGLIDLLGASPLFADVALTAPITPDPDENKERFALQAQIKTAAAERPAGAQ